MKHCVVAVRDTCVESWLMPWYVQAIPGAVRALGDVVNKPGSDNQFYCHPEHYQLYHIGTFDDETGLIEGFVPVFIVDCQSLILK